MRSALVLNATYEPLSIVSVRRAVCLVLANKADLLHDDGTELHAAHMSVPAPVVIRLRYVVKVPYHRRTALSRRAVFARDAHRCQYCGGHADSIDHVVPRSRGGEHAWDNVVASCRPCNLRKRDRSPEEAGMRLFRHPAAPRELAWVVVSVGRVPDAWKPYLAYAVVSWTVERVAGRAADFHARELPAERGAWLFEIERPALVLGSTQPPEVVRPDVDIDVVRRRSGGGAVWLAPGETLWLDVVVPRGDPLWEEDIGRGAHWLGEVWAEALGGAAEVHTGAMVHTRWSRLICFAGLGPGEVTIGNSKIVGVSQRRTRHAARLQSVAYSRWDPAPLLDLLAEPKPAIEDLAGAATGVGWPLPVIAERLLELLSTR